MSNPKRFVFDTNTIVSALLFRQSIPRQAFDKAFKDGTILQSVASAEELTSVLNRDKFDKYVTVSERTVFLISFVRKALAIETTTEITDCRDPKDNKFLALAIDGQADAIITGDDDLLVLHPFRGIPILTPREFVKHLERKSNDTEQP
jgi:putative PIN family toxin of toxin-antitoxin system